MKRSRIFVATSALIPEFYYDLIGRITPGAVLCLTVGWDLRTKLPSIKELDAGILILLAILLSYIAGFVLDVVSGITIGRISRMVFWILYKCTNKAEWQTNVWQNIRDGKENAYSSILTKMMAERTMLRSFLVLWIFLWLLDSSLLSGLHLAPKIIVLFLIVIIYYHWEFMSRHTALQCVTTKGSP